MVKAFLFDYDGVITQGVPDGTLSSRLADNLGISEDTASGWIADIWAPLLTGKISEDEVFQTFEEKYGKPISAKQRDIWFTWTDLTPLPIMTDLLHRLKTKGYPLGVLSNATASTIEEIGRHGGYDVFDFVILSSEVGTKKPEPEIFEIALKKLPGIRPDEVVFLDDREPATVVATELGLKTILVKDHFKAVKDVQALLLHSTYDQNSSIRH
jgi:epoxide hydrolase-like predicted phosphatase